MGNNIRSPMHVDPEAVNKASVSFSSKFFVSDRLSDKEVRYYGLLGSTSMTPSGGDMAGWLEEILRES